MVPTGFGLDVEHMVPTGFGLGVDGSYRVG